MNYRKTRAEISASALTQNLQWIRQQIADAPLVGIVKADGYGHGVGPVCRAIHQHVDALAVGFTDEALALQEAYPERQLPVLILEGCQSVEELRLCAQYRFSTVVHNEQQLRELEQAGLSQAIDVWLKVDTGMHRLGVAADQVSDYLQRLEALDYVASILLMSHVANADNGQPLNHFQRQQFDQLKQQFPQYACSFHNSAATLNPQLRGELTTNDWVRVGLLMYGVNPSELIELDDVLRPAMTLKAPVIATHDLQPGDAVGYGSNWVADRPSRIATVAIGYADGYPRQCQNGTPVFINGHIVPLVGRVSMDMITIDITDIADVTIGDDVELWGEHVDVREVAECAGTISWHLLTGTSVRVPRVEVD